MKNINVAPFLLFKNEFGSFNYAPNYAIVL